MHAMQTLQHTAGKEAKMSGHFFKDVNEMLMLYIKRKWQTANEVTLQYESAVIKGSVVVTCPETEG